MTNVFSAIKINDEKNIGFEPNEYSRFKHGSKTIARKFGKILAREFFQSKEFYNIISNKDIKIVVCSSPYSNIPTATFALKDYFIAEFNKKLVEFDLNPVEECKIYRSTSYVKDYGSMSATERERHISNEDFYIDKFFVKNKYVIFIDDVKITGSHQRKIESMIDIQDVNCDYLFMYFAELCNKDIKPSFEDYINNFFIKSLLDIDWIIKNDKFIFNTRVVKYILSRSKKEFVNFINYQSEVFLNTLYKNGISNSYHKNEEFKENLNILKEKV